MLQSIIIYLLLITSLIGLSLYTSTRTTKLKISDPHIILMLCIYAFINGIRYDVGVDYLSYLDIYQDYYRFGGSTAGMEGGWTIFTKIFALNGIHYSVYFGIIALIQFYFLIFSFKYYSKLLPYIVIVFFLGNWFANYINVLRQTVVITIFLYVVIRHRSISFFKYVIISFLCMTIHFSAILMILYYPLLKKFFSLTIKPYFLVCIYILANVIGLYISVFSFITNTPIFLMALSVTDYEYYLNSSTLDVGMDANVGLGFLLNIIINIIIIYNNKKFITNNQERLWFALYYLGVTICSLFPTSILLTRLFWFATIFTIPVYAIFVRYCFSIKCKQKLKTLRFNQGLLVLVIMALLFTSSMIINPTAYNAVYHFFWEYQKYTV